MPITITMPALSPTMEEGAVKKWLVKEGDKVTAGQIIAEIETDKATMEYEAVDDGRIGKLLVPEGDTPIKVNAPIAIVLEEGESDAALKSFVPASNVAAPAAPLVVPPAVKPAQPVVEKSVPTAAVAMPKSVPGQGGKRVFASPLARRLAASGGVELTQIAGSGPHGRIIKRDVDAAVASGAVKAPVRAATVAPPSGDYETIPHTPMRKTIARRLTESKSTIPHFYLTIECDLDALLALRVELNKSAPRDTEEKPDYKLSVNDFIIRASALALCKVPEANASWTDVAMLQHKHADVGVAVAIDGGLITPIIWRAETKGIAQISNEMKDLAGRARVRKLKPEEYQGGTFSISNLGMAGIKEFAAVINPPHSMILAVGEGEQRPVVKKGAIAIATRMSCTLSCDHRVVDGMLGAKFLSAFKAYIENPLSMLV